MFMTGPFLALGRIGATELIVILLIVLVVFGPQQLPKLSKMFGETIKNFKKGMDEASEPANKAESNAEETGAETE